MWIPWCCFALFLWIIKGYKLHHELLDIIVKTFIDHLFMICVVVSICSRLLDWLSLQECLHCYETHFVHVNSAHCSLQILRTFGLDLFALTGSIELARTPSLLWDPLRSREFGALLSPNTTNIVWVIIFMLFLCLRFWGFWRHIFRGFWRHFVT